MIDSRFLDNSKLFHIPDKLEDYEKIQRWIASVKSRSESEWIDVMRWYARNDLFYLLNFILTDGTTVHSQTRKLFHYHQYYVDMCRNTEYQARKGGGLDYSARGTGKSIVRSKALPILLLLNYPDISIIIFSTEKQLAQKHVALIKDELSMNELLKTLFDDILWRNPKEETLKLGLSWSRDEGLTVKRKMIRRNATVETHALFGGGPLGSRPDVVIADDIESSKYVSSEENIQRLKESFSEGVTLITPVVIPKGILMVTNTKFSKAGLIEKLATTYAAKDPLLVRGIPGEDLSIEGDCPLNGQVVYPYTTEILWDKWEKTENKEEYGLQIALDYTAASITTLNESDINFYTESRWDIAKKCVTYINIDASRGVVDPTAIWVWGIDEKGNKYWIDGMRKYMDPSNPEFFDEIEKFVYRAKTNSQRLVEIRVDQQANQPWADLIKSELSKRSLYESVVPCTSRAKRRGLFADGKYERLYNYWSPMLRRKEVYFPLPKSKGGEGIVSYTNSSKKNEGLMSICLVDYFLSNEFNLFPRMKHDDLLDAGSLLMDEKANEQRPLQKGVSLDRLKNDKKIKQSNQSTTWMSA